MKPIIGITVDCKREATDARSGGKLSLNWNYAEAVADAGGVPLLIPPMADMSEVAQILDGWLIPGGADIDAKHFGEENHPKVGLMEPARYEGESKLYRAIDREMPIFGICYGCQFVNVIRGGSLIQHLPDVVGHDSDTGGTLQEYQIEGHSKIGSIIGNQNIEGKSYHHQAIKALGEGLKVVGKNEDGTIEAIEAEGHPWLIGLQWHPERTSQDEKTKRIFVDFIRAATRFREAKLRVGAAV